MRRRIVVLIICTLIAAACGSQSGSSDSPSVAAVSASSTRTPSPVASPSRLDGEWDTGPLPASALRAAIMAAGYTRAEADEVLGKKKQYEFRLTFYSQNGDPWVMAVGWDPSRGQPGDPDHGPYKLLPGHRLKMTCDTCDMRKVYQLFSYDLQASTLRLRFIRSVDPHASAYDRRYALAYGISMTFAPLHGPV